MATHFTGTLDNDTLIDIYISGALCLPWRCCTSRMVTSNKKKTCLIACRSVCRGNLVDSVPRDRRRRAPAPGAVHALQRHQLDRKLPPGECKYMPRVTVKSAILAQNLYSSILAGVCRRGRWHHEQPSERAEPAGLLLGGHTDQHHGAHHEPAAPLTRVTTLYAFQRQRKERPINERFPGFFW